MDVITALLHQLFICPVERQAGKHCGKLQNATHQLQFLLETFKMLLNIITFFRFSVRIEMLYNFLQAVCLKTL